MRMAVSCLLCTVAGVTSSRVPDAGLKAAATFSTVDVSAGRGGSQQTAGDSSSHIDRFLDSADTPLVTYRAVRRLEAAARNGKMQGSLVALTSLDSEKGFQFEILEESGSNLIRSRVLRAALEAEQRARQSGESARSALTRTNYDFQPLDPIEPGLVRVGIKPRRP